MAMAKTMTAQGSCLAGLTHLGAALLVLLGFLLVLLAYRLLVRRDSGGEVEENKTRRGEDINKDRMEEKRGEDNLGYKAGPDSEDKSSSLSSSSSSLPTC